MKKTIGLLIVLAALRAHAITPNVDLRDVARFGSEQDSRDAQALINELRAAPQKFGIPAALTYAKAAPTVVGAEGVSTAEIQNQTASGYDLFLIFTQGKNVTLNRVALSNGAVTNITSTDLTKNPPSVQIDIFNRQFIVSEQRSGYLRIAPLGVGSLVNNRLGDPSSGYKSLSATFSHAYLSRSKSELSRKEPDYYGGRPFLRVIDEDQSDYGGFTPFGMHYQISGTLERGFVSNGCFRTRDVDLFELSNLVFLSRKNGVPFSVVQRSANGNRHPYPLISSWYNTPEVVNDERGRPAFKIIEHGLYQFDKIKGSPEQLLSN